MNSLTVFSASALEITIIYMIIIILDPDTNRLKPLYAAVFVAACASLTTVLDYFDVPVQFIIHVCFYIVAFWVIKRRVVISYITDILMANLVLFASQYLIMMLFQLSGSKMINNYLSIFICLAGLLIISILVYRFRILDSFLSRFYRKYRRMVLVIAAGAVGGLAVITILWNSYQSLFWENVTSITIIVLVIFIFNAVIFIILLSKQKQQQKLEAYKEYGMYLSDLTQELERRQHEYKNELNTIIGLAEVDRDGNGLQDIISYANTLLQKESTDSRDRYICEDALMSAILSRMRSKAEDSGISFDFFIPDTMPEYHIPANELAELVTNLLNNAFEYAATLDTGSEVCLELLKDSIRVYNTVSADFDVRSLSGFGKDRSSTEGSNRGYGSINITDIIKRNNGKLDISMEDDMLIFTVTFD